MKAALADIRRRLAARATPATLAKLARLIPGAKALGVTVPDLRALVAEYRAEHKAQTLDEAADLLDNLCHSRVREELLFGVFLLAKQGKRVATLPWARVDRWAQGLDNWETCDQLAANVAAPVVSASPALPSLIDELVALTASTDQWRRRFAVATAASLNQRGRELPAETLRICKPLLGDTTRLVQKATGWAIREACKSDEPQVFAFLIRHRSQIPARLLTESAEKLTAAHRRALLG